METTHETTFVTYVFTVLSVIFYSIVYFPQIKLMFNTKSSEGLSLNMMLLWTQADVLSLAASIVSHLQINVIALGWYDFFMGAFTTVVACYFKPNKNAYEVTLVFSTMTINAIVCILLMCFVKEPQYTIGESIGWFTSAIYILGRCPQLYLNFRRKSTEGLSMWMYTLSFLGNIMYLCSIFTYSTDTQYIKVIMPWIVLTCVVIFLDILLFVQYKYYQCLKKHSNKDHDHDICVTT